MGRYTENRIKSIIRESIINVLSEDKDVEIPRANPNYTHYAVSKKTQKIVNGWDYSDYDPAELRQFKNDYFFVDLIDYELDPKNYVILTRRYIKTRLHLDPDDYENWAEN